MKMVVNMSNELYNIDSKHIIKWNIISEEKIGDTYFMKPKEGSYFSCHENFWDEFKIWKRNHKINQIIQK